MCVEFSMVGRLGFRLVKKKCFLGTTMGFCHFNTIEYLNIRNEVLKWIYVKCRAKQ